MRIGLGVSVVSHAALLAVGLISLGGAEPFDPAEIEAIPIELVPVEDISNIRLGSLESDVIETDTPSAVDSDEEARLAEPTGNSDQDQIVPQDTPTPSPTPTEQSAPEPQPVADPVPVANIPSRPQPAPQPEPEAVPAPPEPQPEEKPEPAPAPTDPIQQVIAANEADAEPEIVVPVPPAVTSVVEKARAAYAEKQKQQRAAKAAENAQKADAISDIINKEETRGSTTGSGGQKTAGKATGRAARLTQSEKAALASQMRKCWNPPISALEMDGLTIRLLVDLNRDGSVGGTPQVIDISVPGRVGEATAGAAQRAVRRCGPYKMPGDKYEEWRQVDVTFDPKDLR